MGDLLEPAPRYRVTLFIGSGGDEIEPLGRTRDLSISGMFLETEWRPPVDSLHEIAVVWGEDVYLCTARVVRHADDGIGLTYVKPDDGFRWVIEETIRTSPPIRVGGELEAEPEAQP